MKKLILKENQVKNLIDNLVVEQQTNKVVFSVDFQNAFPSGQFEFTPNYEKIVNDNVEKINQFIKGKKLENFKLVISCGESQVPNPVGFEEKGSLAKKRGEVLKGYLDNVLPKILGTTPTIEISQPIIGKTPWVAGKNSKDDPKYTVEQFVKVNVVLVAGTPVEPEIRKGRDLKDSIFMNNRQGIPSGIGFVWSVNEFIFDPNYGYRKNKPTYYELTIYPSDTDYYKTVVGNNQKGLEDAIQKAKAKYKTDIVLRGTTTQNNYSPESIEQMKRQNLFTPSK